MDHLEPAISSLTAQSDLIKRKRAGQFRQMTLYSGRPSGDGILRQPRGQGHVESKFLHHVRVAPLREQRLLLRVQTGLATACDLCRARRGAKPVKRPHTGTANPAQPLYIPSRRQRQKTTQCGQFQSVASGRREADCKGRCGGFQCLNVLPLRQTKWRLQRRMKPVFARCHRDVIQIRHIWLKRFTATQNIPAKPRRSEIGQRPVRRHIVNCKSRV